MEFDVKRVVRFETAHIKDASAVGLNGDRDVTLFYEVPLGAGSSTEAWLQANRTTIKDVAVDHQDIKGTWRSVAIESQQSVTDKKGVRVAQTFRKGWITSIVSGGTVDWSEARLVEGSEIHAGTVNGDFPEADTDAASANPQEYNLIRWTGVDPSKVDAIAASIEALSASGWTLSRSPP